MVLTSEREQELDWVERTAGNRDEEMERNPFLFLRSFTTCCVLEIQVYNAK